MRLYIRIVDGQPFEHPIFEENMRQAFPEIDLNNLPSNFARFERVPGPPMEPYEKSRSCVYEWVDGAVKDVWQLEPMNEEEMLVKQGLVKAEWLKYGFPSWVFNEETCSFEPPAPYPDDGGSYEWDEASTSWILIPPSEEDAPSSPAS
jgi:hypothetical protein